MDVPARYSGGRLPSVGVDFAACDVGEEAAKANPPAGNARNFMRALYDPVTVFAGDLIRR